MSSFRKPITIRRVSGGGPDANGRPSAMVETPIQIMASVQPASGKQMEAAPEGRRARGGYILYTTTQLRTVEGGAQPDRVMIFGQDCEVFSVKPWQNTNLAHFEALVLKREAV